MIKPHIVENLRIMDIATSKYHDIHLRTIRKYIFFSRVKLFYFVPAFIGILQIKIARKIGGLEYGLMEGEKRVKSLLSSLPKTPEKVTLQREIEAQKIHNATHQHLIKEWKWIADGIAIRAFDYNIEHLRILSENDTTGSLQFTGKGFQNELFEFKKLAVFGNKLALLAEITNWIRIGDIILFEDKRIGIIEIKSSKQEPDERLLRQQKRLSEITDLFNNRSVVTNLGKVRFKKSDLDITTFFTEVRNIIKSVNKGEACAKYIRLDSVISVAVHNYGRAIAKLPKNMTEADIDKGTEILDGLFSSDKPDFQDKEGVMTLSSFDHFNQKRGQFIRLVPPYTVYPFSAKVCSDLISGKLMITTFVDTNALKLSLEKAGWNVERVDNKVLGKEIDELKSEKRSSSERYKVMKDDTFFILRKDHKVVHFPLSIIIKMGYEFFTSDCLVKMADEISNFNMTEGSEYGNLVHFQKQREIWR